MARLPFYYGWVIVGAAFVTNLIATGIQLGLSVLVVPMEDDLGWQRGDVFLSFTVRALLAALLTPFFARYIDRRYGGMLLLLAGSAIAGAATIAIATVQAPWQFMLYFGVLAGIAGPGQAFVVWNAVVPKWFVRRRGKALALATMGTGAAALVMPLTLTTVISAVGWRDTWVVLGAASLVLTLPLALLLRRQPEDIGLRPDGGRLDARERGHDEPEAAALERSFTAKEAVRLPATWLMVLAVTMTSMSLVAIPTNLVPMLTSRELSLELAAAALTVFGSTSMLSRFGWGVFAERTHPRQAFMLLAAYGAVMTALFVVAGTQVALLFVLAAAIGFAVGGIVVLNPLIWPTYLGRRHLGAIMGFAAPITMLGGAGGPYMMAKIYDLTGSYTIGLLVLTAGWVVCGAAMYLIKRRPLPSSPPA